MFSHSGNIQITDFYIKVHNKLVQYTRDGSRKEGLNLVVDL